ncbi:MAG TPA: hypothetical protein VM764_03825, partial [Gemmatimonadaceae bacterium]|nr:hypothetical protein [Gemmatimonadaceae bacterium]
AAAGRGFASQADHAALFTERAVQLAREGGVVALLVPAKLWIALAGGGVREYLLRHAPPLALAEWKGHAAGFDAVVYPSTVVARKRELPRELRNEQAPTTVALTMHRGGSNADLDESGAPSTWTIPRDSLALEDSAGAPWLLLPAEVRAAFLRVADAGVPLAASSLGRPVLGVKSGCNEAFVVERVDGEMADAATTRVRSGAHEALVERSMLRPLLRGEHLRAWEPDPAARAEIIWTHDQRGAPLRELPRDARAWLLRWRRRLEQRTDGRGRSGACWWALFRTEAARHDRPRVVWGDIGLAPRAVVLRAGDPRVPLNTCYVVRTRTDDDAHAFAALLNSRLAGAWLAVLAEPARGGYRRFLGWTCARLPVPRGWGKARETLAPLGRAAAAGDVPSEERLTDAVLRAYGLAPSDVASLIEWSANN